MAFPPVSYAPKAIKLLHGVFAVYKPSGIPIKALVQELQTRLLKDINKMEQRPQKKMIMFKPLSEVVTSPVGNFHGKSLETVNNADVPVLVPDWFDHPLVQGPRYTEDDFRISYGHLLDVHACGVQVFGLQNEGEETLERLKRLSLPRRYRAKGEFGMASLSFGSDARIVEKSTWDHITEDKLDKVITVMVGAHRNACILASGINLSSQRAYEIASKGSLKPQSPTDDVILDMKLSGINLPEFTIDVTCLNESCMFVRQIIHEIGLELKSTAICTHLQRQSDSIFTNTDEHTLLGHHINVNSVIDSIQHSKRLLRQGVLKRRRYFKRTVLDIANPSRTPLLSAKESSHRDENEQFSKLCHGTQV